MKQRTSMSRQRGASVVATIVLALVVGIVLIAGLYWFSKRPAAEESAPGAATTGPAAEQVAAPEPTGDPAVRAETAMQEKRMFVPPGENAFELYLQVADADPQNIQARNALGELFPYAVLFVEQRIAAGDADDGERVLGLMQRADAAAPALPRLEAQLAEVRRRQAEELANEERRAAEAAARAATAATTTTDEPAPQPAAEPAAAPPVASTPPPAAEPAPQPVATPPPAQAEPAAAEPARPAASRRTPVVVSSAQPRYPVMAKRRGITGRVELQFTVRADGTVSDIEVVSSEPKGTFDRDAIAAMERWRFEPGEGDVRARRAFDFKLD